MNALIRVTAALLALLFLVPLVLAEDPLTKPAEFWKAVQKDPSLLTAENFAKLQNPSASDYKNFMDQKPQEFSKYMATPKVSFADSKARDAAKVYLETKMIQPPTKDDRIVINKYCEVLMKGGVCGGFEKTTGAIAVKGTQITLTGTDGKTVSVDTKQEGLKGASIVAGQDGSVTISGAKGPFVLTNTQGTYTFTPTPHTRVITFSKDALNIIGKAQVNHKRPDGTDGGTYSNPSLTHYMTVEFDGGKLKTASGEWLMTGAAFGVEDTSDYFISSQGKGGSLSARWDGKNIVIEKAESIRGLVPSDVNKDGNPVNIALYGDLQNGVFDSKGIKSAVLINVEGSDALNAPHGEGVTERIAASCRMCVVAVDFRTGKLSEAQLAAATIDRNALAVTIDKQIGIIESQKNAKTDLLVAQGITDPALLSAYDEKIAELNNKKSIITATTDGGPADPTVVGAASMTADGKLQTSGAVGAKDYRAGVSTSSTSTVATKQLTGDATTVQVRTSISTAPDGTTIVNVEVPPDVTPSPNTPLGDITLPDGTKGYVVADGKGGYNVQLAKQKDDNTWVSAETPKNKIQVTMTDGSTTTTLSFQPAGEDLLASKNPAQPLSNKQMALIEGKRDDTGVVQPSPLGTVRNDNNEPHNSIVYARQVAETNKEIAKILALLGSGEQPVSDAQAGKSQPSWYEEEEQPQENPKSSDPSSDQSTKPAPNSNLVDDTVDLGSTIIAPRPASVTDEQLKARAALIDMSRERLGELILNEKVPTLVRNSDDPLKTVSYPNDGTAPNPENVRNALQGYGFIVSSGEAERIVDASRKDVISAAKAIAPEMQTTFYATVGQSMYQESILKYVGDPANQLAYVDPADVAQVQNHLAGIYATKGEIARGVNPTTGETVWTTKTFEVIPYDFKNDVRDMSIRPGTITTATGASVRAYIVTATDGTDYLYVPNNARPELTRFERVGSKVRSSFTASAR